MARARHFEQAPSLPQPDQADGCPHPRDVYSLVGHEQQESRFADAFNRQSLHHAWLITGPQGIGKASLAYRMVRTVLGGQPQTDGRLDVPEGDPVAQRVASLGHGDFLSIRRPYDEKSKKIKSVIPIEEARKVTSFFSKKAAEGGWRVCIIDTIDEMNIKATNAVLKTLEEPPDKCLILLISKAPGRLLPTIRSRCMELQLRALEEDALTPWLRDKTDADAQDIANIILMSGGAPGRAYALAKNADTVIKPLQAFTQSFPNPSGRLLHMISDQLSLANASVSYQLFCDALMDLLRAQALYAHTGEWDYAFQPMAKSRSGEQWDLLRTKLQRSIALQAGLNMNKKTVLLSLLRDIANSA